VAKSTFPSKRQDRLFQAVLEIGRCMSVHDTGTCFCSWISYQYLSICIYYIHLSFPFFFLTAYPCFVLRSTPAILNSHFEHWSQGINRLRAVRQRAQSRTTGAVARTQKLVFLQCPARFWITISWSQLRCTDWRHMWHLLFIPGSHNRINPVSQPDTELC
jgi:hypothetical protein